jgi:hypothetical protein
MASPNLGFPLGSESDDLKSSEEACKWDHNEGLANVVPSLFGRGAPLPTSSSCVLLYPFPTGDTPRT